jgi:hypothetical protein
LFDQNVKSTWNRFLGKVEPFLESVKTRLGLTEYKVKLDEETTTDELVDRNILYAKIFLKPARSIEFIALDFVITSAEPASKIKTVITQIRGKNNKLLLELFIEE